MNTFYRYSNKTYDIIGAILSQFVFIVIKSLKMIIDVLSYLLEKTVLMCETISNNLILNIIFEYVAITLGLMAGSVLILISLILGAIFFTIIVLPTQLRDTSDKR
jgi:hypothetical protein